MQAVIRLIFFSDLDCIHMCLASLVIKDKLVAWWKTSLETECMNHAFLQL